MRILFAVLRVVVAGAIIAAVVGQLNLSIGYWGDKGGVDIATHIVHFFSFFTIESNILSAVVLLIGAYFLLFRTGGDPQWYTLLRAATATYMITTGVVYNLLLRGIDLPQGSTLGWSNEILHVVACVWLLIDWLLAPGRTRLRTASCGRFSCSRWSGASTHWFADLWSQTRCTATRSGTPTPSSTRTPRPTATSASRST